MNTETPSKSPGTSDLSKKNGTNGASATPEGVPAKGHPAGLYVLFFTEMWERFSYYGMRALLMLYMVNYYKWTQANASNVYKWYTSLVYLTPLLGGFLADRYLGNKRAVIIGASLMAVGHFLMAFEPIPIFYAALIFLILGNGMFKPNMSTQVGRLYPKNDGRRDAAYTIFYMGINLGAFFSPLVCGYLRENYGFHYGFGAAGVGMVIGLITYLVGLRWVKEVSGKEPTEANAPESDDEKPSIFRSGAKTAVPMVFAVGVTLALGGVVAWLMGKMSGNNATGATFGAGTVIIAGVVLSRVHGAARDKVLAIYSLALFVIFFWASFEQAGNAMNVWADQATDRYVSSLAAEPAMYPTAPAAIGFDDAAVARTTQAAEAVSGSWWHRMWNPVSTEWFQSINPLAIFILAPLFAWLWISLDRRKLNPSIPTKMGLGVAFMSLAFATMVIAAKMEDRPSQTSYAGDMPAAFVVDKDGSIRFHDAPDFEGKVSDGKWSEETAPAQAGRLGLENGTLKMRGVMPEPERDRMLRATAPRSFVVKSMELAKASNDAKADDKGRFKASVVLDEVPAGFDLRWAGFNPKNLHFDEASKTLSVENIRLADKDYKALLVAGAHPQMRDALGKLYVASAKHKVSSWWLLLFYILSTVGELCLSPVGLSMVSKLAPARFATMLMGMWLLMTFFGNFVAGAAGESWGMVTPSSYFFWLAAVVGGGALVLFLLTRKITAMMHGIR